MRKVDVVVLDKTGTLTEGHPTATGWLWAQPQEEHFKDVLLAAELKSEHPLAGAIVAVLQDEEKITPAPLSSFAEHHRQRYKGVLSRQDLLGGQP